MLNPRFRLLLQVKRLVMINPGRLSLRRVVLVVAGGDYRRVVILDKPVGDAFGARTRRDNFPVLGHEEETLLFSTSFDDHTFVDLLSILGLRVWLTTPDSWFVFNFLARF